MHDMQFFFNFLESQKVQFQPFILVFYLKIVFIERKICCENSTWDARYINLSNVQAASFVFEKGFWQWW